jgi:membrane-bound ClpP family serine protease
MTGWLIFAIFLYFLSAALIVAEVFIPSGGVLGGLSFLCLLGGIYIFFDHSAGAGIIGVIIAVIMIPLVLILSYKTLPRTRFGKSVILNPPSDRQGDGIPDGEQLSSMLNQTGTVMTDLRPVGMVDFSGKRIECVAETGYIAKDTKVTVIKVQSTQLTVRKVEES